MVNVSDATFVNLDQLGPNSTFVTIRPVSSDSLAVPSTSSEQPIVIENEDPQMGPDQNPCSSNANKKISAHMNPNWLENLLQNETCLLQRIIDLKIRMLEACIHSLPLSPLPPFLPHL